VIGVLVLVGAAAGAFVGGLAVAGPGVVTDVPADAWLAVLSIGAISTAFALLALHASIALIGAAQASVVGTIQPVWTVTAAAVLLGEPLSAVQVLGGALVISAILLGQSSAMAARPPGG
jgi:drug/metabolite transporter (DMT)-like permease